MYKTRAKKESSKPFKIFHMSNSLVVLSQKEAQPRINLCISIFVTARSAILCRITY